MSKHTNYPNLQPKKYAVALCSVNVWGVIMSDEKQEIVFPDAVSSCWTGYTCRTTLVKGFGFNKGKTILKKEGQSWASKNPFVIAHLEGCDNMDIDEILALARRTLSARNI